MNRYSLLLLAAVAVSAPALAQYSWIDDHGTRVFSDRPPPPGTPPARILKPPRGAASTEATPAEATRPTAPTLADRDADFRKRAAEREADERKATQDAQRKADNDAQCAAARRSEVVLTSGVRIADMDDKGERVFVTDEEKARRLVQVRRVLAGCR
ncbi:DUF4124 domain-containing protein [Massilia cellulosiltytica]|uniref:DUF4124 domain-containing protein n=1 Tax=Massilia cellulosiltytica TaxID=2683234 RepID=UPI0039B416AE